MKHIVSILASAILLTACATPRSYPTYTAPVVAQAEPEDEESGFSTEEEDRKAEQAITSAQQTYAAVQGTTSSFVLGTSKCDDRSMTEALLSLQAVDEVAQRYLQMSTAAPNMADREAAMDVLDELNKVILDGLLDVAKAYRSHKCFPYANHIIAEAKRIYSGPAYENWVKAMDTELAAIAAEQVTAPATTAKSTKRAVKKKEVAEKDFGT